MKQNIGLVLSGGGAKGAYEIGVWKALEDHGCTAGIGTIVGTSVGALNAALIDSGGIAHAEEIWLQMQLNDLLHLDAGQVQNFLSSLPTELLSPRKQPEKSYLPAVVGNNAGHTIQAAVMKTMLPAIIGNIPHEQMLRRLAPFPALRNVADLLMNGLPFSQEKIGGIIDREIRFDKLHRAVYAVCHRFGKKETEAFRIDTGYYPDEVKKNILLASAAIPGVYCGFAGVDIMGYPYYDGGAFDAASNTPVAHAYAQGCRGIIAVHLHHKPQIPLENHQDAEVVHIVPSQEIGNFFSGTLNLTQQKVHDLIALGYADARNQIFEIRRMMGRYDLLG